MLTLRSCNLSISHNKNDANTEMRHNLLCYRLLSVFSRNSGPFTVDCLVIVQLDANNATFTTLHFTEFNDIRGDLKVWNDHIGTQPHIHLRSSQHLHIQLIVSTIMKIVISSVHRFYNIQFTRIAVKALQYYS